MRGGRERGAGREPRSARPRSQPILGKAAAAALRDGGESARRNAQDALFPAPRTNERAGTGARRGLTSPRAQHLHMRPPRRSGSHLPLWDLAEEARPPLQPLGLWLYMLPCVGHRGKGCPAGGRPQLWKGRPGRGVPREAAEPQDHAAGTLLAARGVFSTLRLSWERKQGMSPPSPASSWLCVFSPATTPLWAWAWEAEKWGDSGYLALLQSPVLGHVSDLGVLWKGVQGPLRSFWKGQMATVRPFVCPALLGSF